MLYFINIGLTGSDKNIQASLKGRGIKSSEMVCMDVAQEACSWRAKAGNLVEEVNFRDKSAMIRASNL